MQCVNFWKKIVYCSDLLTVTEHLAIILAWYPSLFSFCAGDWYQNVLSSKALTGMFRAGASFELGAET